MSHDCHANKLIHSGDAIMTLEGKGFFTWKIPNCEHGDPKLIAAHAKSAGLTHLVVKVADGTDSKENSSFKAKTLKS